MNSQLPEKIDRLKNYSKNEIVDRWNKYSCFTASLLEGVDLRQFETDREHIIEKLDSFIDRGLLTTKNIEEEVYVDAKRTLQEIATRMMLEAEGKNPPPVPIEKKIIIKLKVGGDTLERFELEYCNFNHQEVYKDTIKPDWSKWQFINSATLYQIASLSLNYDPSLSYENCKYSCKKEIDKRIEIIENNTEEFDGEISFIDRFISHSGYYSAAKSIIKIKDFVNWAESVDMLLESGFPKTHTKPLKRNKKESNKINILGNSALQKEHIRREMRRRLISFDAVPKGEKASLKRYFLAKYHLSENVFDNRWKEMDDVISSHKTTG